MRKKVLISTASIISILIVGWWYFYWVPYLVQTYGSPLFFPKGLREGFNEIYPLAAHLFEKFYFDSLSSYIALPFMLIGFFVFLRKGNKYVKWALALITVTFFVFILKTGAVFPMHNYYIIPFTPIMALMVAYGLSIMPSIYTYFVLVIISIEGILNQQHDFFLKPTEMYKTSLESIIRTHTKPNKLIVVNGTQSPQLMYFAHRKGWSIEPEMLNKPQVDYLKGLGASYLVIDRHFNSEALSDYPIIYADKNFNIYELKD